MDLAQNLNSLLRSDGIDQVISEEDLMSFMTGPAGLTRKQVEDAIPELRRTPEDAVFRIEGFDANSGDEVTVQAFLSATATPSIFRAINGEGAPPKTESIGFDILVTEGHIQTFDSWATTEEDVALDTDWNF